MKFLNKHLKKQSSPARHLAIVILHQCHDARHTLDHWLTQARVQIDTLNRPDRALFHAIVYGVLRWQSRLDWIIDQLVARPGKKMDTLVRIVLRVGLFQIIHLDRVPSSAAVNTAVEWAKRNHRSWATGFINSLLRRAATQADRIDWPDVSSDRVAAIATRQAFPPWLIKRWIHQRGENETVRLCKAINAIPPLTVRVNTLKTTRTGFMADLEPFVEKMEPCRYAPEGIRFSSPSTPMAQWPMYDGGRFQIQDEAAQIIAHLVAPRAGQKVWDVCAGLGTKTAHLAQLMENNGDILATDHNPEKLNLLNQEMQRLSIDMVETKCISVTQDPPPRSNFHRILVDAPCSGLGVLQKNPDGKWRTQADELNRLAHRQLAFLSSASVYLAPGGLMVYAVCSMEPEENEAVIDGFLQKHQEFVIHKPDPRPIENIEDLLTRDGFFKSTPHRDGMDGFFAAILRKRT